MPGTVGFVNDTYVARQSRTAALTFAKHAAGCAAAIVILFWRGVARLTTWDPVACMAAAGAVVCGLFAKQALDVWQRRAIGAASERRVARVLETAQVGRVFHSLDVGAGGDADHIVVGPGVVVVETKTGTGQVRADATGVYVGQRRIKGDPVRQVTRQAAAVGSVAGMYVTAVVCVVDMTNQPFQIGKTVICSLRDLPQVVSNSGHRLADERLGLVVDSIRRLADGPKL